MTATQWLRATNPEWEIRRPKTLFRERREGSKADDVHLTPSQHLGVLPQQEYMAVTGSKVVLNLTGADKMKHVEPDDFVIHLRSFQGGIEHSRYRGKVSNAYTVLSPADANVEPRYFRWVMKSPGYIQELQSTTNQLRDGQSIGFSEFASVPLPLPPLEEQRRIADFLDDQTTCIDQILRARARQVRLLDDERRSHAAMVVTSSPDSSRVPLKRLLTEVDVRAGTGGGVAAELLSVSIHRGVVPRSELTDDPPRADVLDNYKRVAHGDLVLNRMRAFQGAVGVAQRAGIVSPDYAVLRCADRLQPEFAHFVFRSTWFVGEMVARVRGVGSVELGTARTPRINVADLMEIEIPAPGLSEQRQLLEQLRRFEQITEEHRELLERQSLLLMEFKRSLISSAVSGEFDVSAASARAVPA